MKYNININQIKCIEFWLNLQQWWMMDILSHLSTWAEPIITETWIYYYLSRWKLIKELPIISNNKNTFQKIIKSLKDKWLIEHYHNQNEKKWYYRLSSLWKTFTLEEKNHQATGKKSSTLEEKNHHYNTTIYNTTNDTLSSNEDNNNSTCKVKDNNKDVCSNNINKELDTHSTCSIKEEKKKKKDEIENRDEVFEKLWIWYCKQNTKKQSKKNKAKEYFDKLIKTNYDLNLLRYALPRYIESVNDKTFIVLLRTYLSDKLYLDYKTEFDNLNKQEEVKVESKEELIDDDIKYKYKRTYDTSLDNINTSQLRDDDIKIKYKRTYEN